MSKNTSCEKEFIKSLNSLVGKWSRYSVWQDFIILASSTLICLTGQDSSAKTRICEICNKYSEKEIARMRSMITLIGDAYENDMDQDFLGTIMMKENIRNSGTKQLFTPYDVNKMIASFLLLPKAFEEIERSSFLSVSDPCCGSGGLLIAAANHLSIHGISYQNKIWFVAQDIDYIAAMVCYIQLSILGCPGYIAWGNSLTHPAIGPLLNPIRSDSPEIFYTIQSFVEPWPIRKQLELAKILMNHEQKPPEPPDTDPDHIADDDACSA